MASHKSQGLTLPRTISDLGPSESIPVLAYVALSRMMKLSNLMIEPSSYVMMIKRPGRGSGRRSTDYG